MFRLLVILVIMHSLMCGHGLTDEKHTGIIGIGTSKQLFIDRRFVESSRGITFSIHPPVKAGPVDLPEQPTGYVCVLEYNGTCYMYYLTDGGYALAVSKDGITWERPGHGISLVFPACREGSVFLDPKDSGSYPFKAIFDIESTERWDLPYLDKTKELNRTLYLFRSHDGIEWEIVPGIAVPFLCDSQNQCLYDSRIDKYVAYLRGFPEQEGLPHRFKRVVVRTEIDNLLDMPWPYQHDQERTREPLGGYGYIWNEMEIVLAEDEKDPPGTDLYNPNIVQYPFAADAYLAFPALFRTYGYGPRESRAQSFGRDLRGEFEGDGLFEVQLAVSRDGRAFTRFHRPYLSPGLIEDRHGVRGETDCGLVIMGIGIIRRGDMLYQYYYGTRRTHISREVALENGMTGEAVMRAVQRLDGFVSVDAGTEGGEIITPLVRFGGNRLELNADCGGTGELRVELLNVEGTAVPGYALEDAVSIDRNGTAQEIWWSQGPDVGNLAGTPVRLRIVMRSAALYAFRFNRK